jgi:hypothetical protein
MSPSTMHVLHHGGECQDGGLRWLRNIGTCLTGYATSYTRKRYLTILGQCIGNFLWESGRICVRPHPVENISVNTVFGSHIFSRDVAAKCPRLVKFSVCGTRVPGALSQYDCGTLLASLLLVRSAFCSFSVVDVRLGGKRLSVAS